MIAHHLEQGTLVALVPNTPLDVPLYWQQARAASTLLEALTLQITRAAHSSLIQA
jgi:LysR family transcriptional regulator (chromosome initiation inhibitor)